MPQRNQPSPARAVRAAGVLLLAALLATAFLLLRQGPATTASAASVPSDCLRAQDDAETTGSDQITQAAPGQRVSLTTRVLGKGAWSYFGDPRAVTYGPWIYTGWITNKGYVKVSRFKPGIAQAPQTATLGRTGVDDHNNPSLMVTAKGRILAFFSPHSGRFLPKSGPGHLYYRFTEKPGAIRHWTPAKRVPVNAPGELGFTYPNPISLSEDKTFLAWRGGCWKPTFAIRKGTEWGDAREIVQGPNRQRPYAKYAGGLPGSGVVHMCYTETHPKQSNTSVHCLEYKDRRFSKADGERVAGLKELPIPAAKGDEVYRYSEKYGKAWVMDVMDDGEGRPTVIFSTGYYRGWQRFMFGRWTGERWQVSEIAPAFSDGYQRHTAGMFETGGMAFDPLNPYVVYLGRVIDHRAKVEKWESLDKGRTWQRVQRVSPTGSNCFRPTATALKGQTTVLFVCGNLKFWTNFQTSIQAVTLGPPGSAAPEEDETPNPGTPAPPPVVPDPVPPAPVTPEPPITAGPPTTTEPVPAPPAP